MKKILLALTFLVSQQFSYGQTLYSEFDQYTWDGIFPSVNTCPSFSVLCVDPFLPCPSPGNEWHRMGSPDQLTTATGGRPVPNPSDIHLFCVNQIGEGLFTDFAFNPAKAYKITVGVKMATGGRIVFGAADDIVETPTGTTAPSCAQDVLFKNTGPGWSLNVSSNNFNSTGPITTGEYIGNIIPIVSPLGAGVKHYSIVYNPTAFYREFSLQFQKLDYYSDTQNDIVLEYIKIEEACNYNSNFSYKYNTFNPLDVEFSPYSYSAPAPYSWQFGDGNISSNPGTVTNMYPSFGTYHPSLAIGSCLRQFAKVCLNEPDVNNYIPGNTFDPQELEQYTQDTRPCNPHFEFFGVSTNPYEIGITTLGGHTGANAFNVHWGDGTNSTNSGPQSFIHTYAAPGTYNVCVEADDKRCTVCMAICIEQLGTGDNGGDGSYGSGEGKNGVTSIAANNVLTVVNSIVPNPAKNTVTLNIESQEKAKAAIKIFDITGKTVLSTDKNISKGRDKIDLDVQHLTPGVYIIEVKSDSENIIRAKMIKE